MSKIHELLAVEKDIKGTSNKIITETQHTFLKKDHFESMLKAYEPINADDVERLDEEYKPLATTVAEKLDYFSSHMVRMFDIIFQKEASNAEAKADIIIKSDEDGDAAIELAKDVPVSALVQLENVLDQIRSNVYDAIPTLDPQKKWEPDVQRHNVFVSEKVKRLRTKKIQRPIELSKATEKHAAQVQLISEDVAAGYWIQTNWSGAISSAEKSDILRRLDLVTSAVKKARARANNTEVKKVNIGKRLFSYINKGE